MRAYLILEYDGTAYSGWQRQKNGVSVQERVERAAEKVLGRPAAVVASGRTDAGVHASGQVAHLDYEGRIPPEKLAPALNALLPADISVKESGRAADGFDARKSAKRKTYVYRVTESRVRRPLLERYAARVADRLDVAAMDEAARALEGERDFRCFLASGSQVKSTVRTVYSARVFREGETVTFEVTGNGFLYNMVRIMAGTLIAVGRGKTDPGEMEEIIASRDRKRAGKTAPAAGLCLKGVEYQEKAENGVNCLTSGE